MINLFFVDRKALQRLQAGPLNTYIDKFAALLSELSYAKSTGQPHIRLVADLSRWLQQKQLKVKDLNEQLVAKFFKYRRRHLHIRRGDTATLQLLLKMLRGTGKISNPSLKISNSPIQQIERRFTQYLLEERNLSQATLLNTLPFVRQFLTKRFGKGPILLNELHSTDITRFVLQHTHTLSPACAKLMAGALRCFLRFLYMHRDITTDLAQAVPAVANWRLSNLPKYIEPEQVKCLLKSCDQTTILGQRNYTILLILARLGLRAGEVVNMRLDDIDWEAGEFIVHGKGNQQDRLPIPYDVGKSLAKYLRYGRPRCSSRQVFIRTKAPIRGFANSSRISTIVMQALKHAGINSTCKGAHLLRHSLATNMLRRGASFNEIGEILRHKLMNTTEIYAKVDLQALRKLAQPWPGGTK